MRQERRAEAQSLMQIAGQLAPVMAQSGAPLNLKAFMEKTLDAYDVLDKERYFLPPAAGAPAGGPPPPGGPQAPPPQAPANGQTNGVTNTALAAGPSSPSNVASMSPETAMARMMSQYGGAANQGGGGTPT
jgi:hypothetical protein